MWIRQRNSMFDVISFDVDQTLIDFDRTLSEALKAVAAFLVAEAGRHLTVQHLQRVRNRLADDMTDPITGQQTIGLLELRRLSFIEVTDGLRDQRYLVDEAMALFERVRFGSVYLFNGVKEVLSQLKTSHRLAVITNGNSCPERIGLSGLFDPVVMAERLPFKKPDPRIFDHMMSLAGDPKRSTVCHVGDSLSHDVDGANKAGLVSVWFNPARAKNTTKIKPDYEIRSMTDLFDLAGIFNPSQAKAE